MKRPVSIIVAQVLTALLFVETVGITGYRLFQSRSVFSAQTIPALPVVLNLALATFFAIAFIALTRRIPNAQFLGAASLLLFLLVSLFGSSSRALFSALTSGLSSTELRPPYFNFNNRAQVLGGVVGSVALYIFLLSVALRLIFSRRVRAFVEAGRPA